MITDSFVEGSPEKRKQCCFVKALDKVDCSFQLLCLNQDHLGDVGLAELAERLVQNQCLSSVELQHNGITDLGMPYIARILQENFTITSLNMSNNSIGDLGASVLAEALPCNHSLRHLRLAWNHIGSAGACALFAALERNCSVRSVDLRWNRITDEGADALLRCLSQNDVLCEVGLKHNPICEQLMRRATAAVRQGRCCTRASPSPCVSNLTLPARDCTVISACGTTELDTLKEQLASVSGSYQELMKNFSEQQTKREADQQSLIKAEKTEAQLTAALQERERVITQLQQSERTFRDSLAEMRRQFEDHSKQARAEYDGLKQEFKRREEKLIQEASEMKRANAAEMEELRASAKAAQQELEQQVRSREFRVQQLSEELQQLRHEHETAILSMQAEHQTELQERLRQDIQREHDLETLKLNHGFALDENAKFIEKLEEIGRLKRLSEANLAKQAEAHAQALIEEKNQQLRERAEADRRVAADHHRLAGAHALEVQHLHDELNRQAMGFRQAENAHVEEVAQLRQKLRDLEQQMTVHTHGQALTHAYLQRVQTELIAQAATDKAELLEELAKLQELLTSRPQPPPPDRKSVVVGKECRSRG
eukprot:RCo018003